MFGTDLDHRLADIEYSRHQLSLLPVESSPKEVNTLAILCNTVLIGCMCRVV